MDIPDSRLHTVATRAKDYRELHDQVEVGTALSTYTTYDEAMSSEADCVLNSQVQPFSLH